MLPVKKTLIILAVLCLVSSCSVKSDFANSTEGQFFKISYPDSFVASFDGSDLKLDGQFKIVISSYRFTNFSQNDIDSNIENLKSKLGGTPKVDVFSMPDFECRKLTLEDSDKKNRMTYAFWTDNWLGVLTPAVSLDSSQESLVDSIVLSIEKIETSQSVKTDGKYQSELFEINIPEGWSGQVVNHFKLSMTKDMIADGAGSFDVSVTLDEATKDAAVWAKAFAEEMGWTLKTGSIKINGVKFLTFKNIDGNITTRVYCAVDKGKLAVMVYSVSSPVIEKQALEIAKGFKIK